MTSKRKYEDGGGYEQSEHSSKSRREFDKCPAPFVRDRFEMTHIYRTNQEMADFVRESVVALRRQQAEIDRLNGIIARLQANERN